MRAARRARAGVEPHPRAAKQDLIHAGYPFVKAHAPWLRAARRAQVGVEALFLHHAQQLVDLRPPSLPLPRAQWLFALAARLDKPLRADAAACFRGVLRRCAALRAGVGDRGDPLLPRLNVLIAVAGAYFGQDEGLVRLVDAIELF